MRKNKVIIALDYSNEQAVWELLTKLQGERLYLKIGLELFYSCGASLIEKLKEQGHQIFLDLKLHDIPNTVKKAMVALARLDIDMINTHAAGGQAMLVAALEGLEKGTAAGKQRPLCLAVTQLTSTSERIMNEELRINGKITDTVVHYGRLAKASGLDGVVSSPLEVPLLKEACGPFFLTVTPGIRLGGDQQDDQVRITTPREARSLGSDFIVVGRSITASDDPLTALTAIEKEWSASL